MDPIPGEIRKASQLSESHYDKIGRVLLYFQSLHGAQPDPFYTSGKAHHCPFPDTEVDLRGDITVLDASLNRWIHGRRKLVLRPQKLIFCHRDFAPRNMIWAPDGSVYLLDWLTAGFYPVTFEICSQRNGTSEDDLFNQAIDDSEQLALLQQVWENWQTYIASSPE